MSTRSLCTNVWKDLTKDYEDRRINIEEEVEGKNALVRVMRKAYGKKKTDEWLEYMWHLRIGKQHGS